MTDLINRLRNHALPDPNDEREVLHAPLLKESADEIESLRQQLAKCERERDEVVETLRYLDKHKLWANYHAAEVIRANLAKVGIGKTGE